MRLEGRTLARGKADPFLGLVPRSLNQKERERENIEPLQIDGIVRHYRINISEHQGERTLMTEGAGGPVVPEVYLSPYTTKWGAAGVARASISRASLSSLSHPAGSAKTLHTLVSADRTTATKMLWKLRNTIVEPVFAYRSTGVRGQAEIAAGEQLALHLQAFIHRLAVCLEEISIAFRASSRN